MFKLPFIEKTYVGLEVDAQKLIWVELNKLGSRIELVGYGEIPFSQNIEEALNEFKTQVTNDSYFLGCVVNEIEQEFNIMDTPFFEEESDFEKWLKNYQTDLENTSTDSIVSTHTISLGDEERRILTQINKAERIQELSELFNDSDLPLFYLTDGSLVSGYSQIFNPDFVDGYSGVITTKNSVSRLVMFHEGRIVNAYELGPHSEPEVLLAFADSILKSEELTLEIEENAIGCYHNLTGLSQYQGNRSFSFIEPFFNKGKKLLPAKFAAATGVAMKMCYPELDDIEVVSEEEKAEATFSYDKTELIRTAILLFAPLVVFLLIAFAVEKFTEPSLNEVSQISALVANKLDMVSEERAQVTDLKQKIDNLRKDYGATYITAPIFEIIASATPEQIWLEALQINGSGPLIISQAEGIAQNSELITRFIQSIQSNESVELVRLLSSEQLDTEDIAFSVQIESKK